MAVPETFTCFPRLPLELRDSIWTHASFGSRNLDTWMEFLGEMRYNRPSDSSQSFRYATMSRPPPILHTSREARNVGLRQYHSMFEVLFAPPIYKHRRGPHRRGPRRPPRNSGVEIRLPPQIYYNDQADPGCMFSNS